MNSTPGTSTSPTGGNASDELTTTFVDDDLKDQLEMPPDLANYLFILYSVVTPILFGLITLVGIIGNCLVIYVILSKVKMRTVTNLLLLNLAFADLSFVLICPPFTAFSMAMNRWPFGNVVCKLMHYLLNVTVYVTIYTLVLISAIRYMTIVYNTQTVRYRTKKNVIFMCVMIWFVMLALNVPILLSYGVIDADCDNYGKDVGGRIFATFFAFAYVMPLFIIAVLSICILHHINKQKPTMLDKKTKSDDKKKQASRLLVLVVVIFAIFWLPVHIHLLVAFFGTLPEDSKFYMALGVFWQCLAYFNACINPFIYNYASKDFRDSFREVVCCAVCLQLGRRSPPGSQAHTECTTVNGNAAETKRLMAANKSGGELNDCTDL